MDFALVAVTLSLLCKWSMASPLASGCVLPYSKDDYGWVIEILWEGETVGHGGLVTRNRVLSAFTPFIRVAEDRSLLTTYEFIGLHTKSEICEDRKAIEFIPPLGWPRLKPDEVRNIAFWEFDKSFDVSADFVFLFPRNDDKVTEVSEAIDEARGGETCIMQWLRSDKGTRWGQAVVKFTTFQICKESFCKDGVCKLEGRYDFCVSEVKWNTGPLRKQEAMLICHSTLFGILGISGQEASRGRTVFISVLTVGEVSRRLTQEITKTSSTTATTTTATAAVPTTTTTTTTTDHTISRSPTSFTEGFTGRLSSPPNTVPPTTSYKKQNRYKPNPSLSSSGRKLVVYHGVLAVWAAAFHQSHQE